MLTHTSRTSIPGSDITLQVKQLDERVPAWFAVYTCARHEKKVAEHLASRGIEYFLPTYVEQRRWKNGMKKSVTLPLFPGYLFVRLAGVEKSRALQIPGVHSVVGDGSLLAAVEDREISLLQRGVDERAVFPHVLLQHGTKVRVIDGPLAGMQGILATNKASKVCVVLTMPTIRQSFSVEMDSQMVEAA